MTIYLNFDKVYRWLIKISPKEKSIFGKNVAHDGLENCSIVLVSSADGQPKLSAHIFDSSFEIIRF